MTTLITFFQAVPSIVAGAAPSPFLGEQNLQGLSSTAARVIENPCVNSSNYFVGGSIRAIDVVVKEADFTAEFSGID